MSTSTKTAALLLAVCPAIALAQASATPAAVAAKASKDDKVICRSTPDIGSLVSAHKDCKTKREWDAERQATQARIGDCVNSGTSTGARC